MSKVHNFSAGPAILPQEVIQSCIDALQNFENTNLSLIEVSHRGKEFVAVMDEATSLVKKIMNLGDDYDVLYMQGGASSQFLMTAFNLLENKAALKVKNGQDLVTATDALLNDVSVRGDPSYNASHVVKSGENLLPHLVNQVEKTIAGRVK